MSLRHEYKHPITYHDYLVISGRLKHLAKQDKHVGEDGTYRVRSLYFDNLSDKALREKIEGTDKREKFRIRYYNEDTDFIRLEKKSKIHGLCEKVSVPVTREEVIRICRGDIGFLAESDKELLLELYAKMRYQMLRPKVVVDYKREPYVYGPGNVRVTFDSDIRTSLYRNSLFERELLTVPAQEEGILMEVKYDAFLPEIMQMAVRGPDRQAEAFSKYAVCRRFG
jgi:SPX domain protein involved in polyphosphate accumulation